MSSTIPTAKRCEIKFVSPEVEYNKLMQWIRDNQACFFREFPSRQVNNVYFDSFNFHSYYENISGSSSRVKVRYRWYGESPHPVNGALEVKWKRNHFSGKTIYGVSESLEQIGNDWGRMQKEITSHLPESGKIWMRLNPIAILINRYKRDYFRSRDGKVRVTLDTCLRVYDQMRKSTPNYNVKSNFPSIVVLEVKFPRKFKTLASQILKDIPLRVSRNSKYVSDLSSISLI
jgi:SPX domain protein involved in polyphosphate accumulation